MLNLLRRKSVIMVAALGLLAIFAMGCNTNVDNVDMDPMTQQDPMGF